MHEKSAPIEARFFVAVKGRAEARSGHSSTTKRSVQRVPWAVVRVTR